MNPPVFKILNIPAVQNMVGTDPVRIYGFGNAPQGTSKPYIVWQVVSSNPLSRLAVAPTADKVRVQIDCYGISETNTNALAMTVRNALDAHLISNDVSLQTFDSSSELYRVTFDAFFILNR